MIRMLFRHLPIWAVLLAAPLAAQTMTQSATQATSKPEAHPVDLALTYSAQRSTSTLGTSFWGQGASVELSASVFHGLGAAMLVSGSEANNIAGSGINQSTVTITFGPRYTVRRGRSTIFAEGLIGESNAFNTVLPSTIGALSSANSLASQIGGGVDLHLTHRFAIRALQANWLRTTFANGSNNVQNTLQVGAGIVLHLQH